MSAEGKEGAYRYVIPLTILVITVATLGMVVYFTQLGDTNNYAIPLMIVVVSWGIVPTLAKLGELPGDITTFWVNWFAAPTVAILITVQGGWGIAQIYDQQDYLIMVGIGLLWPLLYSLAYFQSVQKSGGAWTAILNYTWPLFALVFAYFLMGARPGLVSTVAVVLAAAAVFVARFSTAKKGMGGNPGLTIIGVGLGLIAATTQGFYNAAANKWAYDPWIMTFVIEAVTVAGVTTVILLRRSFVLPSLRKIFYLGVIGVISNGIGFWAFLAGSQISGGLEVAHRSSWLIGMCSIPVVQVLLLAKLGKERVEKHVWLGVVLIAVSCLIHEFA